ncbi:MAG: hypothetical protein DMG67_06900 [Acidobacteria bacterium]|nr:MAG: hypothetical protein DMG67_06900 [Acidobacteriota bacterium]
MTQQDGTISKKLRIAGILIILGLIVEGFSLLWNHTLSFLAFPCVGGMFLVLGIVVYLLALVSRTT